MLVLPNAVRFRKVVHTNRQNVPNVAERRHVVRFECGHVLTSVCRVSRYCFSGSIIKACCVSHILLHIHDAAAWMFKTERYQQNPQNHNLTDFIQSCKRPID